MSLSDLWVLYARADAGFVRFARMVCDLKLEAVREARGG